MFEPSRKAVWYGELETASSRTPVIYDPGLPDPPPGQIYLYNSERDAVLRYVLHIVRPLLKKLEGEDRTRIEKVLKQKWRSARKKFLHEYGGGDSDQSREKGSANSKEKVPKRDLYASNDFDWETERNQYDFDSG